jgi:hypothetical protein
MRDWKPVMKDVALESVSGSEEVESYIHGIRSIARIPIWKAMTLQPNYVSR